MRLTSRVTFIRILRGSSFSIGKPEDTAPFREFAEGKLVRYLLAELPNGSSYFFAERFVDTDSTPMR